MSIICDAINERRLIRFHYRGHWRTVAPAAHGYHVTTGNGVLRGYQVGGTRNTGLVPGWGMFDVSAITGLEMLSESIGETPPGYSRNDRHINPIHCQL